MARSSRPTDRSRGARQKRAQAPSSVTPFAWGALGFFLAAGVTAAAWTGCQRELPIGAVDPIPSPSTSATPQPVASAAPSHVEPSQEDPTLPVAEEPQTDPELDEELAEETLDGGLEDGEADNVHYAGAIVPQASIFPTMEWDHSKRLGYVRMAGKVAIDPTPIASENCTAGWYRVLTGGYVCGRHVTLNLKHPSVRLGVLPDIDDYLPYKYGWNRGSGTPLYRSVPSKDEIARYEPYLNQGAKPEGSATTPAVAKADASKDRPWWEPGEDGAKTQVKLADLAQDADGVLARRLVKGFFIAIERTFHWNGRHWHKTTEGLIAPADRFVISKSPTLQGVELAGTDPAQPVGFILAAKARKYDITFVNEKPRLKAGKTVPRYTAVRLTGQQQTIAGNLYWETTEGWWMKSKEGTYTDPGPPPAELRPGEKWIDVNLTRQTLVAFEGETPVYATLVSTGKRIKTHATPPGTWRIKHKHIASRMSGDGVAPGEAPYSIDDVPYVMFYEGSYALHGAFWHDAFGRVRSHGCTNLAPLDAKRLFYWTDPPLPDGWHGVYASEEAPGTWVVIHD